MKLEKDKNKGINLLLSNKFTKINKHQERDQIFLPEIILNLDQE